MIMNFLFRLFAEHCWYWVLSARACNGIMQFLLIFLECTIIPSFVLWFALLSAKGHTSWNFNRTTLETTERRWWVRAIDERRRVPVISMQRLGHFYGHEYWIQKIRQQIVDCQFLFIDNWKLPNKHCCIYRKQLKSLTLQHNKDDLLKMPVAVSSLDKKMLEFACDYITRKQTPQNGRNNSRHLVAHMLPLQTICGAQCPIAIYR